MKYRVCFLLLLVVQSLLTHADSEGGTHGEGVTHEDHDEFNFLDFFGEDNTDDDE